MSVLRPTLKMITVSLRWNGELHQKRLMVRLVDGKPVLSSERLEKMKAEFSIPQEIVFDFAAA